MKKLWAFIAVITLLVLAACSESKPEGGSTLSTTIHNPSQTNEWSELSQEDSPESTQPERNETEPLPITPPADIEIVRGGFAKTKTYYYTEHDGGIIRAPIEDLARQEKVPLPKDHGDMSFSFAEICGITADWLYVTMWETRKKRFEGDPSGDYYFEYEEFDDRKYVTFRIAIGSWKAEALAEGKRPSGGLYPGTWYNPASDSLLITTFNGEATFENLTFEALSLSTRKRIPVTKDGEPLAPGYGHWRTTLDGYAAYSHTGDDDMVDDEGVLFYVFQADNTVQSMAYEELNMGRRQSSKYIPANRTEEMLLNDDNIWNAATVGNFVYYTQNDPDHKDRNTNPRKDFFRIKFDGTERKLLRENTNIFALYSSGGKLLAHAWNPTVTLGDDGYVRQIDMYLLNQEGKVDKTIFRCWDNTEGNSGYYLSPYGDHMIIVRWGIYSGSFFAFVYDPVAQISFPASISHLYPW